MSFTAKKTVKMNFFLSDNILHFVLECTEYHKYVKPQWLHVHFNEIHVLVNVHFWKPGCWSGFQMILWVWPHIFIGVVTCFCGHGHMFLGMASIFVVKLWCSIC